MLLENVRTELELTERHLLVLKKVIEEAPIGILKLAEVTGMQNHKVRYSLRILEQANLIKPSSQVRYLEMQFPNSCRTLNASLEKSMTKCPGSGKSKLPSRNKGFCVQGIFFGMPFFNLFREFRGFGDFL